MSNVIDERIVEMKFDNSDFEKNAQTSMRTLDQLKKSLDIEDAGKGLDSITKIADKFNLDKVSNAVSAVGDRFNALEAIATGAFLKIGSQAVDAGEKLLKAFTVDNISAGWEKFGEMTRATGTLVSQGFSQDEVSKQLERLAWFTDETSYNLTDMVDNIGKFTATGEGLKESVTSMEGIALWAAMSGQNAQKASSAMYQLSQAMSKGALKYDDWKSISNAAMDTKEFREKAVEAAVALGQLKKVGKDSYETLQDKVLSVNELFSADHMSKEAWFSKDVMTRVFQEYSAAVDQLYEYAEEKGVTASEAMEALNGQLDEFALKAFKAGQEARTWGDVVDSVRDAVSSKWEKTFELIIGDYEQATELFTNMANALYEVFAEGGEERNLVLGEWNELGGREELIEGLTNVLEGLYSVLKTVKEAFREIFPPITSKKLLEITKKFNELTKNFKMSDNTLDKFKRTFKGFFSILEVGKNVLVNITKLFKPLFNLAVEGAGKFLDLTAAVGDMITAFVNGEKITGIFSKSFDGFDNLELTFNRITEKVKEFRDKIIDAFIEGKNQGGILTGILNVVFKAASSLTDKFFEMAKTITGIDLSEFKENALASISDVEKSAMEFAKNYKKKLQDTFNESGGGLSGVINVSIDIVGDLSKQILDLIHKITGWDVEGIKEKITKAIEKIKEKITQLLNKADDVDRFNQKLSVTNTLLQGMKTVISSVTDGISKFIGSITDFVSENPFLGMSAIFALFQGKTIGEAITSVKEFFDSLTEGVKKFTSSGEEIKKIVDTVTTSLESLQDKIKADIIKSIATSIAILAGSLVILSNVKVDNIEPQFMAITLLLGEVIGTMEILAKTMDGFEVTKIVMLGSTLIKVSGALWILAEALKALEGIDVDSLGYSVLALTVMMVELVAAIKALDVLDVGHIGLSVSIAFLAISGAMKLIADAISEIGALPVDKIMSSLFAVGATLILLSTAIAKISQYDVYGISLKTSIGLLAMGAALELIADSMVKISSISDPDKFVASLITIIGLIIELSAATNIMGEVSLGAVASIVAFGIALELVADAISKIADLDMGQMAVSALVLAGALGAMVLACMLLGEAGTETVLGAAAIVIMSAALRILADGIVAIGELPIENIVTGMLSMVMMMGMLVAAVLAIPTEELMSTGAGLLLMAAGIRVVADALVVMGGMTMDEISNGLIALGGALLELAIALAAMKSNMSGAASLLIAAVGVVAIAEALKLMDGLENAIDSLLLIGGAIAVLAVACTAMQGAIVGAAAIAVAGAGMLIIAEAFNLMRGIAFEDMVMQVLGIASALGVLGVAATLLMPALIPLLALGGTLLALVLMISAGIAVLGLAVGVLGGGLATVGISAASAGEGMKILGEAFKNFGKAFLGASVYLFPLSAGLAALGAASVVTGAGLIVLGAGLTAFAAGLLLAGIAIAVFLVATGNFHEGINKLISDIPTMIEETVTNLINALNRVSQIIDEKTPQLIEAIKRLFQSMKKAAIDVIKGAKGEFESTGKNLIEGFINGIKAMVGKVVDAVKNVGKKALDTLKKVLDTHSPSKETDAVGRYFDEGLINGINHLRNKVGNSAEKVGNTALDALSDSLSQVQNFLEGDIDSDPTIRPVLDLSNVEKGARELNTMMDANKMASISASFDANRSYREQANIQNQQSLLSQIGELKNVLGSLNREETPVNVNVVLEGDADGVFNLVRTENDKFSKSRGVSAFA